MMADLPTVGNDRSGRSAQQLSERASSKRSRPRRTRYKKCVPIIPYSVVAQATTVYWSEGASTRSSPYPYRWHRHRYWLRTTTDVAYSTHLSPATFQLRPDSRALREPGPGGCCRRAALAARSTFLGPPALSLGVVVCVESVLREVACLYCGASAMSDPGACTGWARSTLGLCGGISYSLSFWAFCAPISGKGCLIGVSSGL